MTGIRRALSDRALPQRAVTALIISTSLLATGPAWGQETSGSLRGRVLGTDGNPAPATRVTITGAALPVPRTTATDERGYFHLAAIPVGSFTVAIASLGHRPVVYEEVAVRLGTTTTLGEVRLAAQVVELDPITVAADRVVIDPTSSALGATLDAGTFTRLPSDRTYRSVATLLPQANASYLGDETNVAGSSGLENMYYIDGVNVTDGYRAMTGTDLPYNFIEAIELRRGGYEAEYGQALGGIINVITYSGGNEFQTRGFGFFTNDALAGSARPGPADARIDGFTTYDVGLSAGGPIVRDRMWFFTAYNPSFARRQVEIQGFGLHDDVRTTHQFAGKLTWRPSAASDVVLSVFGDPTAHHTAGFRPRFGGTPVALANPDPFLGYAREGGFAVSLSGRTTLGSNALLEATAARHQRHEDLRGDTDRGRREPLFIDNLTGTWSGGFGDRNEIRSVRTSLTLSATLFAGPHTLKAGVAYQDNLVDIATSFTPPGEITQNDAASFVALVATMDADVRNRLPSVFLQDSWLVLDRLRLYGGVRWDGQYLVGSDGAVAQSFTDQFQPRLGVTVLPGELGTQKLFAWYGRYYQQLPLHLSTLGHAGWDNRLVFYGADPREAPDAVAFEAVFVDPCCAPMSAVEAAGEHLDEFAVGYERMIGGSVKLTVQALHRILRDNFTSGFDATAIDPVTGNQGRFVVGNPGVGSLAFLPRPERTYTALELAVERHGPRLHVRGSYVLSRSRGNYTGQFDADARAAIPGNNLALQIPVQAPNSTGLLPNDRTHVLKLFGSYRFDFGLTAGTFVTLQSGTPRNELGSSGFPLRSIFLVPRGDDGRLPALWDLNLRFSYDLRRAAGRGGARLVLDLLHVGSPREVVDVDQLRFLAVDCAQLGCAADRPPFAFPYDEVAASQAAPNPSFGAALRHQQPMTVRLGLELGW